MTKTEQDEKITEWLSWGMHNGVCPELLVVAALAIGAAQERSQYPYERNPEDDMQSERTLLRPGVPPTLDEWISWGLDYAPDADVLDLVADYPDEDETYHTNNNQQS